MARHAARPAPGLWRPASVAGALLAFALTPAQGGVRLLAPGDDMAPLSSLPRLLQGPAAAGAAAKLDTIRIAVTGGDASVLAGMTPRAAPFEVVAPADGPDLLFDPGTRQARSKGEVIAYDVTADDLPAVIDRMAFAEGLVRLAAARPQPLRVFAGPPVRRRGDRVNLDLADMQGRALILFVVGGDGLVQALYPRGADPRIIETPAYAFSFELHEPFGTNLVVALSASQPMPALERGIRELSQHRGAGEALKLIALTAPPDARIGLAAVLSAP
jgi:hypothetical protein